METTLNFISNNWIWLGPLAYELAIRLFPSEKSRSIINLLKKSADRAVPNIKKGGGRHHELKKKEN